MTLFAIGERSRSDAEIGVANDLARQQLLGSAARAARASSNGSPGSFDQGAMPWAEEMRQMELLAEHIIPASAERVPPAPPRHTRVKIEAHRAQQYEGTSALGRVRGSSFSLPTPCQLPESLAGSTLRG
jgi:hypothetical protein